MELVTNNNTSTTFLVIRQGSMNDKSCAETKLLNILGQALVNSAYFPLGDMFDSW